MSSALKVTRALRSVAPRIQTARFSVVARRMADGDVGGTRSGGAAQGDAFSKREKASEDLYVRQNEQEKLRALKAKIAKAEKDLEADKAAAEALGKSK